MLVNHPVRGLVVIASLSALSTPALAQTSAPYSGLFRGSGSASAVGQRLDFNFSLVEAYDDDVYADVRPGITPAEDPTAGFYTMLVTAADYRLARRGLEVGVSGTSALRYYPDLREVHTISHSASAGLSARVSRTATLFVNQSAAYSPSYLYGLFPASAETPAPGDLIPAAPDYSLDQSDSYSYRTMATLAHRVGDAGNLSSTGEFQYTDYLHEDDLRRRDRTTAGIRGQYEHRLTRNVRFSSGYRFRSGDFGYLVGTNTNEHGIDFGATYSRALSVSRRADIGFGIGVSTVEIPASTSEVQLAESPLQGRLYRMSGNFTLGYQFRPGWEARAAYRRGLEYIPDLTAPVFLDGVTAGLEGLVTRRMALSASASYSKGESILNRSASAFDTYTGSFSGRYAFTSGLAVFAEYLYYFYDFSESALLAPGLPPGLERNAVRAGLMLWVPAVGR